MSTRTLPKTVVELEAPAPMVEVEVDGEVVWANGAPTRVDEVEVRMKAAESARRLLPDWRRSDVDPDGDLFTRCTPDR